MIGSKATRHGLNLTKLTTGHLCNTGDKMFTKPEQYKQLKMELIRKMKNYNAAKRKRSKDATLKRTRVKYDEAIGKIIKNKTWIKWTTLKPGESLKYKCRVF